MTSGIKQLRGLKNEDKLPLESVLRWIEIKGLSHTIPEEHNKLLLQGRNTYKIIHVDVTSKNQDEIRKVIDALIRIAPYKSQDHESLPENTWFDKTRFEIRNLHTYNNPGTKCERELNELFRLDAIESRISRRYKQTISVTPIHLSFSTRNQI